MSNAWIKYAAANLGQICTLRLDAWNNYPEFRQVMIEEWATTLDAMERESGKDIVELVKDVRK